MFVVLQAFRSPGTDFRADTACCPSIVDDTQPAGFSRRFYDRVDVERAEPDGIDHFRLYARQVQGNHELSDTPIPCTKFRLM